MEKYRQFADGGTGVNPFVPAWSNYKASLPMKLLKVVMIPFGFIRLLGFGVGILLLAFAELLCMMLSPIPPVRRSVQFILTYAGSSMALHSMGFWFTSGSSSLADHRRLKIPPPKVQRSLWPFSADHGCIVIANMQAMTDILFLAQKMCPVYVFPAADGTPIVFTSLLAALRRAGARRPAMPPANPQSLTQIAEDARKAWRGPVVVFAEGARTNGSCVLAFKPKTFQGVESFEKPAGVALAALEYSKSGAYTPHHVVGTSFRHLFWLAIQPIHTVQAQWLPACDIESSLKGKPVPEQISLLRSVLTRMIPGAVEVEVNADKHQDFMAYWETSQRKGYTKAAKKA
eukprot:TRINITY_DN22146_c0_g1_i1.p1 TRINITY_DN22146_c0_g1~~TRINITY_DN22146_c0_g1_i1.p1  ORF type:complete len:344 (+),score=58.38 TRINITY_DN22146_c0_g1_i1:124-1155(+)